MQSRITKYILRIYVCTAFNQQTSYPFITYSIVQIDGNRVDRRKFVSEKVPFFEACINGVS